MQTKKIRNMRIVAVVILVLFVVAAVLNVLLTKDDGFKVCLTVLLFVGVGLDVFILSVTSKKNIQSKNLPQNDLRNYKAEHKK